MTLRFSTGFLFQSLTLNLSFSIPQNLSVRILLSKSTFKLVFFTVSLMISPLHVCNIFYIIFPSQSLFHNLSFTISLSQSFFHNLSFTIFLSQSFFHNLSFTIFLAQSFLHIVFSQSFFRNLSYTIFPTQSFLHNLSFRIFPSQSFLHNLSFTIFLSQSFFHNLSFNLCKIWDADASLYPRVLVPKGSFFFPKGSFHIIPHNPIAKRCCFDK